MMEEETTKFQALMVVYQHWRMPELKKAHRERAVKTCQAVIETKKKSHLFETFLDDFWEFRDNQDRIDEFVDKLDDFDRQPFSLCLKCNKNINRVEVFYHELDDEEWVDGHVICQNAVCRHIHYKSCFNIML